MYNQGAIAMSESVTNHDRMGCKDGCLIDKLMVRYQLRYMKGIRLNCEV